MKATIDRSGRVMLPASVRRAMRIDAGDRLTVRLAGNHIELEPDAAEIGMRIAEDGLPILTGAAVEAPITNEDVVAAIHAAREERIDALSRAPR